MRCPHHKMHLLHKCLLNACLFLFQNSPRGLGLKKKKKKTGSLGRLEPSEKTHKETVLAIMGEKNKNHYKIEKKKKLFCRV